MKIINTLLISLLAGTASAQVGIGTTSPSSALDIETTGPAVDINDTGGGDPEINFQISGTTTFSLGIDNSDADKLKIGTTSPEASTVLTIDASQNVGIGNTSPTATLDVDGSAIFNETGNSVDFRVEGLGEANLLFVDGSADMVGVGTSAPSDLLTIGGITATSQGGIMIQDPTATTHGGYFHFDDANTVLKIGGVTAGTYNNAIEIGRDNSNVVINQDGASADFTVEGNTDVSLFVVDGSADKVGIGTATPANTLDVNGDMILQNGTSINEFSVDGTFAGNSDDAVPTEQAVKEYVDGLVPTLSKTITIEAPTAADDITFFRTDVAITVVEVIAISTGTSPSTTYQLRHHSGRSGGGNVLTTSSATTATLSGDVATLSDATISANSWVWFETTAASGTSVTLSVNVRYTED
mgnify:CR=1 FL=1